MADEGKYPAMGGKHELSKQNILTSKYSIPDKKPENLIQISEGDDHKKFQLKFPEVGVLNSQIVPNTSK